MKKETNIQPVALRNTEITKSDVETLVQAADERKASSKPVPAPRPIRLGKRVPWKPLNLQLRRQQSRLQL